MANQTQRTTDHNQIKKWAEDRSAKPSVIKNDGKSTELIRLDFPGFAEKNMQEISWDEWFDIFEENQMEFIYQEKTKDGQKSNFNKLVNRQK